MPIDCLYFSFWFMLFVVGPPHLFFGGRKNKTKQTENLRSGCSKWNKYQQTSHKRVPSETYFLFFSLFVHLQ